MDKHVDKKSNVSSPVILLLSFLFIALESVRLFTGNQSAYFTDAILPAVWIAAYFLIIAALLLACFLLCIRGMRRQWHHLLRIPLAMYFLYCLAVAGLILTTGYAPLILLPVMVGIIVIIVEIINERTLVR